MIKKYKILFELFISNINLRFKYFINLFESRYRFIIEYSKIYNYYLYSFKKYNSLLSNNIRLNLIKGYIFNSLNCIFKSCKLILIGFPVEASHNNRHFIESISIALLCSKKEPQIYERIQKDIVHFPYHKAFDILRRPKNRKYLNLIKNGLDKMNKIYFFENNLSHASFLTIGHLYNFSKKNTVCVGQIYDNSKKNIYKNQIKLSISACNILKDIIDFIFIHLKKDELI